MLQNWHWNSQLCFTGVAYHIVTLLQIVPHVTGWPQFGQTPLLIICVKGGFDTEDKVLLHHLRT